MMQWRGMTHPISMSEQDLARHRLVTEAAAGRLTNAEAAAKASVTERTIRRWRAAVADQGVRGLMHGNRGRLSPRKIPKPEADGIIRLVRERYADCTAALIAEKLRELHGIRRDPKTVAGILREAGAWTSPMARTSRAKPIHRAWRERRSHRGSLVQFDGSYHDWFEGRGGLTEACLLAAIDDATGRVLHAEFAAHEGTLPVMGFWRAYVGLHGLPAHVYLDKFSTYRMHMETARENHDAKTQLQRAMATLGVGLIFANSPQAKGRVERLFRTLQDRLVRELRFKGIATALEANRFLKSVFLPDFNRRFAVPPREKQDHHRPLSQRELGGLREVLVRQERRVVQHDFTFSFRTRWYQILPTAGLVVRPKDTIDVREYPEGDLAFFIRNKPLVFEAILKQPPAETRKTPATLAPEATPNPHSRTNSFPVAADKFTSR